MGTSVIRLLVACLGAAFVVGCTSTDSSEKSQASTTPAVAEVVQQSSQPRLDERAQRYRDTLVAAGVPSTQSDSTTLLLAQGICTQLAAGTPGPAILDNLRPLAEYTATQSHGALTGDQVARLYLDTARTGYCAD